MASDYSVSASGSGRGSGDSSSDAQQTLSATLSTPSMPDIFVWAPEDGSSLRNSNPQCAFDSADPYFDFGLHQAPPPKLQPSDQHEDGEAMIQENEYDDGDGDSIYEDIPEDFDHTQIVPRRSEYEEEHEYEHNFTREVILQQSPPPPPTPEKPKKLRSRAASFIKSLGRSNKKNTPVLNLADASPTRRATSQDLDRDTIRSKRSIIFNLTRRNKSTTALHRVSTTESDLSLDPDPFSSNPIVPPVPPVPVQYESQVRKPILRRQETAPSSLRDRANYQPSPPLPPLPPISSPPFKPFCQSTPPTADYFSSQKTPAPHKETSGPSLVTPPPRGSSHVKLPSLHFEGLQFDLESF